MVSVYKNPPYPVFYDVVAHSLALVGSEGAAARMAGAVGEHHLAPAQEGGRGATFKAGTGARAAQHSATRAWVHRTR